MVIFSHLLRELTCHTASPKVVSMGGGEFTVQGSGQPFLFYLTGVVRWHRQLAPTCGASFPVEGMKQLAHLSYRLCIAQPLCLS